MTTTTTVFWYCPKHGLVETHPDDGRDRRPGRLRRRPPSFRACPGPFDEDRGVWLRLGCRRPLRRRTVSARRIRKVEKRLQRFAASAD
ncbi:MAG TPA: hypothetical protein VFC99_07175 [Acidimicrobiia bacterium]|nr:hypothetical protein [Acidimicrobiia bacterium]